MNEVLELALYIAIGYLSFLALRQFVSASKSQADKESKEFFEELESEELLEEEPEPPEIGENDDFAKILESCVPDGSSGVTMIESNALRDLARARLPQTKEGEYVTTANGGRRKKPIKCANCGVEQGDDIEIRACAKCQVDGYCSRQCQLAHWPKHKRACKILAGINKAVTSGKNEAEVLGNVMRLVSKQKQPVTGLYATHAGMISSNDTVMPPGVPEHFLWLKSALTEFGRLKGDKREYGEKAYKKLYDDLVTNKHVWMRFFERLPNQSHAGDTCLILEQLAHIYMARGKWDDCAGVLEYLEALIDIVRKHNLSPNRQDDMSCAADRSEHQCRLIQFEMHEALGRPDLNAPVVRHLIRLESTPSLQDIPESLKINWDGHVEMYQTTASVKLPSTSIERLSDEDVAKVLVKAAELGKSMKSAFPQLYEGIDASKAEQDAKMSLLSCAHCGKEESYLGQLKKCTRCNEVVYCNRECQLAGWPTHKKDCSKSKKPKKSKKK